MVFTDFLDKYLLILFSMLLHELGHILAALAAGRKVQRLGIVSAGLRVWVEDAPGEGINVLILSIGPLVNMALFALSHAAAVMRLIPHSGHVSYFTLVNLYLALFNLFPVLPLDGGRLLRMILSKRYGWFVAFRTLRTLTVIFSIVFILLGMVQLASGMHNFSLLLVSIFLLSSVKETITEAALMNMKHIISRHSRFLKKGVYAARNLVALKSVRMGEILKNMDFDMFHFVYVLDDDLKTCGIFSEQEIMDAMLKHGADMTFKEFMEQEEK